MLLMLVWSMIRVLILMRSCLGNGTLRRSVVSNIRWNVRPPLGGPCGMRIV